jgi:predicted RNase H-like HicB family nuclease/predicted DNA binding CopG/RHH family protein
MSSYIALIHPPEPGARTFGVTFPDLPGCVSAGKTREDAIERAAEALGGHIAAMRADGEMPPAARDWLALRDDPEVADDLADGAEPSRIAVRDVPPPKERVNVMIGRDALRRIDEAATARGLNRSTFIEQAALRAAASRRA